MSRRNMTAMVLAVVFPFAGPVANADAPDEQSAAAQWMIDQAKAWAEQACGGKWVLSTILADDFQGTSPKGTRYGKPPGEPEPDPNAKWWKDCTLDEADLRFFGPDIAVMYGAESMTVELPDSTEERRCLVWTDTWLRRNGKWQIVAVQDNLRDCPAQ